MTESRPPYSPSVPHLCDACIWHGERVEAAHCCIVPGGPRRTQTIRLNRTRTDWVKGDPLDAPYYFCDRHYREYLNGTEQRDAERHAKWLRQTQPNQGTLF